MYAHNMGSIRYVLPIEPQLGEGQAGPASSKAPEIGVSHEVLRLQRPTKRESLGSVEGN